MSFKRLLVGAVGGGVASGTLMAGAASISGAIGAAFLDSSGYDNYVALESAQVGAIGGAFLGGVAGAVSGALASHGIFPQSVRKNKGSWEHVIGFTAAKVVSGLVGHGMLLAQKKLIMDAGRTAATFSMGAAVMMIPSSLLLLCICIPLAASAAVGSASANDENEVSVSIAHV